MLTLLLSRDWVACRNEILNRISRDVEKEKPGRIFMVPELISHDTERRLCTAAGDTASRFAEVLSFTRLANRVADYTGHAMDVCLDSGGRVVAMAAATRQLHSRLKAYASVETKPEFLTELVDAVDEFKRCCISSRDLLAAARQTEGTLAQKLEELSLILEAYDAVCSEGKRDPRDQMTWLLEQLEDCSFAQEHVFYIDGFPDYTRQHMAILEYLIQASSAVTIGFNCDRVDSDTLAFEKAGDTAAALLRSAKASGIPVKVEVLDPETTIPLKICDCLFQGQIPEPEVFSGALSTVRADSVSEEVQYAAQKVLELVHSGCRYRDISIVCGDMGVYQNMLSLVFSRCGIPLYQSGTEDILQKTVISTVLSAMDAALNGFEQRDVLRYLKSVLSPLDQDHCDELENYVITWGIRGKAFLREWQKHPDGLGKEFTDDTREQLKMLNEYRHLSLDPLERLNQGFKNSRNLAQQVKALYAFLEEIQLADQLRKLAEDMDARQDNRGAQILNQLWEILLSALEQMYDVLGSTVWDAETFTRLFTLLLSQYDVGTIPPVLDAVMAGPVSAMRCQQVKHLILLGAVEGAFPGYGGSAGLLTDQERVALREMGVPLTGGAVEGVQAEFAEIYGVFCGARETVMVSYPGGQPSYLYKRLAKMSGEEKPAKPGAGMTATGPQEAGAYLARWNAEDAARRLGVEQWYTDTRQRADFTMGRIAPERIRKLYGSQLRMSASQVDSQAECRMSYFLKYGMRAQERKENTVDPAEFGTYVHWVLEHTARDVMAEGGFQSVSLEHTLEMAMAYAEQYAREQFSQLDSERLSYLFKRNNRELEMVVEELWQELKDAKFQPAAFELGFGDREAMPGISIDGAKMAAVLRGFVDRVDIWKENGVHYFRVVDYKTGKKTFDFCDVFNGVGLQMLLYLFALEKNGETVIGSHPVGAGVQYFPAKAPLLSADGKLTDNEAEEKRMAEWKRRGLLLNDEPVLQAMEPGEKPVRMCYKIKKDGSFTGNLADRHQLQMLRTYVFSLLRTMVDDIASGNVEPNPYTRGTSHNACAVCPYGAICHSSEVEGRRNYKTMTSEKFWEEVERQVETRG